MAGADRGRLVRTCSALRRLLLSSALGRGWSGALGEVDANGGPRFPFHEELGKHQERAVSNSAVDRSEPERGGFEVRFHAVARDGNEKPRDEEGCEQENINSVPVVASHATK